MTNLFRLFAVTAAAALILSGCGKTDHADDDHNTQTTARQSTSREHAPNDSHDEHDHAEEDDHDDHDDHSENDAHDDHGDHDDHGEEDGIIRLDDHELSEFDVHFAVAGPGVLRESTSLVGEVVLNPDRVAHVVARAGGIGSEVRRTIGDRVEAGEVLAILESPELAESKADYLSKAAEAALAATDLARAETIHANTIRLLEIIADTPDIDALQREIRGLDIGANRGELITTYAELRATQAMYNREKTLFERKITSESEYLAAESAYKKAFATFEAVRDDLTFANRREFEAAKRSKLVADVSLQAAERRLHALGLGEDEVHAISEESDMELARYEIRAPIAGRIIQRHIVQGESLNAGEQVFVIADLSSVWGHLTLYQRDLSAVREGQTARIRGTHNLGSTQASIVYISPILDEQTRTTTARVILDNAEGNWRPGMFIRAELDADERRSAIVVPRSAIQEIDGETVIFVETHEGIERRDVQLGQNDTESVEVLAGLQPGERYVVSGGLALKTELNKSEMSDGHAH